MRLPALVILALLAVGLTETWSAQRQPVAKVVGPAGTILRRESPTKTWQHVGDKEPLQAEELLIAGRPAVVEGSNGAVQLILQGTVGLPTPLPIIESAVVLHANPDADLDFTFLRGRVDLVNRKAKGEATVRIRGREGVLQMRLLEPGTRVALVLSGRWLPGVPFRKDAKVETHRPAQAFIILVLQGEIEVNTPRNQFVMRATPGPALLEGDDIPATDPTPRRLDRLPDWADPKTEPADGKKVKAALERFQGLAQKKSVADGLNELLQSADPVDRRVAIALLAATDSLEPIAGALAGAKTPDLWDNGVLALRHWMGREPGQDQKLYQALIDKHKLTAIQAETVLQLLHDFSDEARTQPETYEALPDLMESDVLAIRGLAHWQLYRLVPAGRKIDYDPLASPEKRAAALQQWRKFIPVGKLPPSK
jgi:hypothetical protein